MSKNNDIKLNIPAPGYYVLTKDIENPKADRRTSDRHWELQPVIGKGKRFYIQSVPVRHEVVGVEIAETRIRQVRADGAYRMIHWWNDKYNGGMERWNLIAEALEPVDMDLCGLLASENLDGTEFPILEQLIQDGKITLEDIKNAGNKYRDSLE